MKIAVSYYLSKRKRDVKGDDRLAKTGRYSREYLSYLASDEWEDIRQAKLNKVGRACEMCKATSNLQVHHKDYDQGFGYETEQDLIVLCDRCHKKEHEFDGNENGQFATYCKCGARLGYKQKYCYACRYEIELRGSL